MDKTKMTAKKLLPYIFAVLATLVIGIATFKQREVAPFGTRSLLCMDLWGQYFPMYIQNTHLAHLSDIFYSWNGGFGHNNWAQNAYYCNSVFLLLLNFIPLSKAVTAIDIFCLLKMPLAAVAFLAFLRRRLKSDSFILPAAAVAYGSCAYMLAFISQFMWTDLMIYAPLILIGIDRLVFEKKCVFYSVMLAIAIISNFYIGFATCIFCAIYFLSDAVLLMTFSLDERKFPVITGFRDAVNAAVRFAVFSLIAGALSAAVTIPVGKAISLTLASQMESPDKFEWYNNITSVMQDMLSLRELHLGFLGDNLAVGLAVFTALPLYFFNNKIRIEERVVNLALFVFMLISFNCNMLDYMWHGFHFPNQLPGRWSFLFSIFTLYLVSAGFTRAKEMKPLLALIAGIFGIAVFYITGRGLGETPSAELTVGMWLVVAVGAVSGVLLSLSGNEKKLSRQQKKREMEENRDSAELKQAVSILVTSVLVVVMVFDSGINFYDVAQYEGNKGLQTSDEKGYTIAIERSDRGAKQWRSGSDGFYRVEANNGFTFNCSMLGGYHGMRYYSSTMPGAVFELLKFLGNRVYADRVSSVYTLGSPVQNTLFGLKYYMDFDRYLDRELPLTEVVEENSDGIFRENTKPLSVAYAVSDDILGFKVNDQIRALQNQNTLLNAMLGEKADVFEMLKTTSFYTDNATLIESADWNQNYFQPKDGTKPVVIHSVYTADSDGSFFMEHNYRAGKIRIITPAGQREIQANNGAFAYVGTLKKGETMTLEAVIENVGLGCCGINVYRLDEEKWNKAYSKLAAGQMQVTKFKNTDFSGSISLAEDSLVLATIPDDGGWTVLCDGKKAETVKIADTFLGVRLPAGEHTLRFKYRVPGLVPGIVISLIGLVLLICLSVGNGLKLPELKEKSEKSEENGKK